MQEFLSSGFFCLKKGFKEVTEDKSSPTHEPSCVTFSSIVDSPLFSVPSDAFQNPFS